MSNRKFGLAGDFCEVGVIIKTGVVGENMSGVMSKVGVLVHEEEAEDLLLLPAGLDGVVNSVSGGQEVGREDPVVTTGEIPSLILQDNLSCFSRAAAEDKKSLQPLFLHWNLCGLLLVGVSLRGVCDRDLVPSVFVGVWSLLY